MTISLRRAILIVGYSSTGLGMGIAGFLDEFHALPSDGSSELAIGLVIVGVGIIAADWWLARRAKRPPEHP